jgi:hypothetical protein
MTYYVYRTDRSEGAQALVKALGAKRITQDWRDEIELKRGDVVVNWGARIGQVPAGVKVLNNANLLDKLEQIALLVKAKVPTVEAKTELDEWIHRQREHFDGNDLLRPAREAGFWVKRENILKEVRIHSFNGVSIRAGMKVPAREDAHPWIRTYKAGWRIDCDGFRSSPEMRAIAHKAVKALGLEFAAVDIGIREDKSLIVLEANRSPGIEHTSQPMDTYAEVIREWAEEGQ